MVFRGVNSPSKDALFGDGIIIHNHNSSPFGVAHTRVHEIFSELNSCLGSVLIVELPLACHFVEDLSILQISLV